MSLPLELELEIVGFVHDERVLSLVCKDWNSEMEIYRVKAAKKIASWWKGRGISHMSTDEVAESGSPSMLFRRKLSEYKRKWLIEHPEFVVEKLGLPEDSLDELPTQDTRNVKDVQKWYNKISANLSMDDWNYVGY